MDSLAAPMTTRPGFFQPLSMAELTRSLPPAILWAYASVVVGAVLLAAVGLISFLFLGAVWLFNRSREVVDPTWAAVALAAWVAGPVALGGAVWGAAYASTTSRSMPRTVLGTAAAVGVGAALLAFGASGFAVAALAIGWGLAIPAQTVGRVALRCLIPVTVAIAALGWSWGSIDVFRLWQLGVLVVLSPIIAAAWVWLADALWMAARSARIGAGSS